MTNTNFLFLGTQKGLRLYRGGDDHWEEAARHFSGVVDFLDGSTRHPEMVYCCILHDGLYRTNDAGKNWQRVLEGDVRTVAVDPSDDHVVYAGTEPVHLYRSENGGDSWEELGSLLDLPDEVKTNWKSPQPDHEGHIRHIYINPKRPRTLYLSLEHGGIVRSFDRGKSWEDVSRGIDYLDIHKIANHPAQEDLYLVSSARGFFRSTNPTQGWDRMEGKGISRDYFHDFLFLPGNPPAMLIATANGSPGYWSRPGMAQSAIFRSFDGESWSQIGQGLPPSMEKMVWALASSPVQPTYVYAGYGQSDKGQAETRKMPTGPGAVWFSPDKGSSWREIRIGELPAVRSLWISA
jgi:hypothetical protein